MFICIIRLI